MAGTDLKAERKDLYAPRRGVFVDVVVPPMTFLAIDGSGDPNVSEDYRHAIEALFGASYAAKFQSKRELHRDYVVLPLEGQWWAEDMAAFHTRDKTSWFWRMMIRQPDWLGADALCEAVRTAEKKRVLSQLANCAGTCWTRASAYRPCTSAATTTKVPYSRGCTTSTCPSKRSGQWVCTTRSTSVMPAAPRQQTSGPSCVSQ